jgi:hypothetical protein
VSGARSAARQALDLAELEDDLKAWVIELAQLMGWRVVHFRPARTARGWRTAYEGDDGFPDLVLARDGVVLVVELKSQTGRFRPGQREWLAALGAAGRLWRPSDREEIRATLTAPRAA